MGATGAEIASAYITLQVRMPGVYQDIEKTLGKVDGEKAGRSLGKSLDAGTAKGFALGGAVAGIVADVARRGIDSVRALVTEAVSASDATDKFKSTLDFAGIDARGIKELTKSTRVYADATVYDLADIQNMTAQLASNGVRDFAKLGTAAGNLNAVAGGNADTFKSVGMVMTQTAGQGKLVTENWNQLTDAIPGAAGPLMEAMKNAGAYTGNFRDAMAKGEVTADEFNAAVMNLGMTDAAKEAATSTSTMEGAIGNLQANVVGGFADLITLVKPALTEFLKVVSDVVGGAFSGITNGLKWLINNSSIAIPIIAGLGTVLVAALAPAIWGAVTATWAFTTALLANPVSWIVLGIGALVAAIVALAMNWSTVTAWISKVWADFLSWITGTMNGLAVWWTEVWSGIKQFFTGIWNGIVAWFQEKFAYWQTVFQVALLLFAQFWTNTWNNIKSFFANVWDGIVTWFQEKIALFQLVFSLGLDLLRNKWQSIWTGISTFFSNVWTGIKSTFIRMIDYVKTKPVEAFEAARDAIGKAWEGIKALAKEPVVFVVKIINGLINKINDFIPGDGPLKTISMAGFSEGGYTGNVAPSAVAGVVHGNEHVIRAQSRQKIESRHPGLLDHMNRYGNIPGYRSGGLVTPLPAGSFSVSQPYSGAHNGIDLAAPMGTPVMAAGAGVVGLAGVVNMGGNEVYIQHDNGLGTRYSHLSRFATKPGMPVKAGNVIGYVGSTGMSTGPHLHYMVHNPGGGPGNYGNHVNPAPYLNGSAAMLGEAWNPFEGLTDWAMQKFTDAFPGGDMFVSIAASVLKQSVGGIIDWGKGLFGADGHTALGRATLYDKGGLLPVGKSLVENKTGRPEPILTASQWDSLLEPRQGLDGQRLYFVLDDGTQLSGYIDARADRAVDRGFQDSDAARRRAAFL